MNAESLVARVEFLERQNRQIRRLLGGMVVLGASAFLMAQAAPTPAEVRATKFVVVDAKGTVRGTLAVYADRADLELRDEKGSVVRLGSTGDRATLRYRDADGRMIDLAQPGHGLRLIR